VLRLASPWRRKRALFAAAPEPTATVVTLDTMRRRLELLLAAIYGRPVRIVPASASSVPPWYKRIFRPIPEHLRRAGVAPQAGSNGERIELPASLEQAGITEPAAAVARYKLLALQQAERIQRGTSRHMPGEESPLERDLFLLSESVAVDRALARSVPSMSALIARERMAALTSRPEMSELTPAEREMEALIRAALSAPPAQGVAGLPAAEDSAQSRAWAAARSRQMRGMQRAYRGLPLVSLWGAVKPAAGPDRPPELQWGLASGDSPLPSPELEGGDASDDADASASEAESDEGVGASASGQSEAAQADASAEERPIPYPEWDYVDQTFAALPALVRLRAPVVAMDSWATEALELYAPVIRRLRERFDKLRARRVRLVRQRDGDELDMSACIEAYVDSRTSHAVGDRLYSSVRPARRALAIVLLVDISGSTEEKIRDEERVIDVAKLALLIVTQALDALGDPYAIVTFSGRTRENVRMRMVKDFADASRESVRQRISGLAPEGYTRAGAAIRHATAMLMRQPAGHRLLLLLSDGKPNDDDGYTGRYAVEDTRQSILEAQGRGVHPYCLTIDRKGHDYLTRIFGESGHTILQRPEQLPLALADVIRRMLGARS